MENITPDLLKRTIEYPNWSADRAISELHIHPRTWRRWLNGSSPIPYTAYRLLHVLASGELPGASPSWRGWRFFEDKLYSPDGWDYSVTDLRHLAWIRLNQPDIFYHWHESNKEKTTTSNVVPMPDPRLVRR